MTPCRSNNHDYSLDDLYLPLFLTITETLGVVESRFTGCIVRKNQGQLIKFKPPGVFPSPTGWTWDGGRGLGPSPCTAGPEQHYCEMAFNPISFFCVVRTESDQGGVGQSSVNVVLLAKSSKENTASCAGPLREVPGKAWNRQGYWGQRKTVGSQGRRGQGKASRLAIGWLQ